MSENELAALEPLPPAEASRVAELQNGQDNTLEVDPADLATATVRYTSYGIDTMLLTSAAMLLTILPGALFANGWLTAKLSLLVVYIVLGICAMRAQFPRGRRAIFYAAALLTFFFMFGIARMHQPLGWLSKWSA